MKLLKPALTTLGALLLGACTLGPDFQRPTVELPAAFRAAEGWTLATPGKPITEQHWWKRYQDPLLDELLPQVSLSNQNLLGVEAQYRQALALAAGSRASAWPSLGAGATSTRAQGTDASPANQQRLTLSSSWEIDLWGRISRGIEAGDHAAQASAADLAAARLSAQAALLQNYVALRINDAQQRLFERTLEAYTRSLEITRNRLTAGVASQADVAQAETQLRSTEAQALDLRIQRAQLEHAIAVLVGKPPAHFSIAPVTAVPTLPDLPLSLPSELLERRPDVAAALHRVAADNARIGAAEAAFFPSVTLSVNGGFQNASFADLFAVPHRFWSLGPALAQSLFDGGARRATSDQTIAAYDRSVANYRQTVLTALQETEDNLVSLRILAEEREIQLQAARAANTFLTLTTNQYLAGTVSYLNVAIAQAAALNAERSSLELLNRHLQASIGLIRALGGSPWQDTSASPPAAATVRPQPLS